MIGKVQNSSDSFQSLRIQIDGFNSSSQLSEPLGSLLGGLVSPYGSLGSGDSLSGLDRDCPSQNGSRSATTLARSQSSPAEKGSPTPQQQIPTSRYKTEMCRPFSEHGTCKYGDKCQFAHGNQEVRNVNRHPKYKTDLCKTYHSVGFCPYGPRCHFIHALDEMRAQPAANPLEKKANSPVKQLPMFGGGQSETSDWSFPASPTSCDKQNQMSSAVSQLGKYFNMSGGRGPSTSSIDSSRSGSFCSDDIDSSSLPSSSPPPVELGSSPRRPLFNRLS